MSLCTNARRLWQRIMTVTGIGYAGDMASGSHRLGAFLEAHIEQGPILERHRQTIGVVSGAGHDACHIARVARTAMLFVPCAKG